MKNARPRFPNYLYHSGSSRISFNMRRLSNPFSKIDEIDRYVLCPSKNRSCVPSQTNQSGLYYNIHSSLYLVPAQTEFHAIQPNKGHQATQDKLKTSREIQEFKRKHEHKNFQ